MPAGRPPKLTEVKVLEGTYRPDRQTVNEAEPERLANIPDPPEGLSEPAGREWLVVCHWLHSIGQLALTDLTLLAAYCNEVAAYWEADAKVKKKGAVIEFYNSDGDLVRVQPSPWTALRTTHLSNALRLASQFGFTPVMRSRISGVKPKKEETRLQKLLNKHK